MSSRGDDSALLVLYVGHGSDLGYHGAGQRKAF